ncbi:flagellin [Oscillibacter sp.]|uniref:flagellin N-terminal helical domain-containing protein n=2 Tax=unclassified Oscillibacter TaxID=2629304 RepID=UPI00289D56B5|nr:flagellin [Oscillibacter sp.]
MRIQHNIMSMNAYRNFSSNTGALSKNLEKLSSGYRINRAGDDAAGLAISEKMRAQISGLEQASSNAKSGINLVQTAEGALTEVHSMLNRMVTLANQSANGTFDNETDRANLQKEVSQLTSEIDRIADSSNFNGIKLLDGSLGGGATAAKGASFEGAKIAASQAATMTTATIKSADMATAIDATAATKDYLKIDGQAVTIDWANDADAKALAAQLKSDLSSAGDETLKDIASKLENVINNAAKSQGVTGSVSVSAASDGKLTIKSNNKGVDSEFSFIGSNAAVADIGKSVMSNVIMGGSGDGAASVNTATLKYDGKAVAATDVFNMNINGVKVAAIGGAIANGDTMAAAAAELEKSVQAAVDSYNDAMGLSANVEDAKSGLTGLDKDDFTVTVGDNGNFVVNYTGDVKNTNFSFEDVGERSIASELGLANGSSTSGGNRGLTLQIGDTAESFNQLTVSVGDMHTTSLGISGIDISTQTGASSAIEKIKSAINSVSSTRGTLGALQNRLDHTINNLGVMTENIQDAESTVRDVDVAKEMMAYTKNNILVQSAQAMLAQANQVPQGVLQLLQ